MIAGSIIILLRLFFLVGQVPLKNVEVFVVKGAEGFSNEAKVSVLI